MKAGFRNHLPDPIKTCREALRRGFLTKAAGTGHWLFGARKFHPNTVNTLIDAGEAIRVGDHVVRWSAQS